jgi:hypothetical protein
MVRVKILAKGNIDSLTRKIPYWKILIGMGMVEILRELLSIAY